MPVLEEERLVGVVRLHARIAVEVIGGEVRDDPDRRMDGRRVVQLVRRDLERHPGGDGYAQREFGERHADVARLARIVTEGAQEVSGERGGRGLAVGARDGDVAQRRQRAERDLEFPDDRHPRGAGGAKGRRAGRDAGACDDERRLANADEVVRAEVHGDARAAQGSGRVLERGRLVAITRVHVVPATREQQRGGGAALAEPDDGDFAGAIHERVDHQRSLSVLSARKAQKMPRIQNRTTTCDSGHPFSSKW